MQGKKPFLLSPGTGGVDRFDRSGKSSRLAEAFDVINDDGELRRRDAFRGVITAPGHALPANRTIVRYGTNPAASGTSLAANRLLSFNSQNALYTFVGCDVPFDSVRVPIGMSGLSLVVAPSANTRLQGAYWNGSAWTSIPWLLDSTRGKVTGTGNYAEPYIFDGAITFHRSQLTGWATTSVGGSTLYWIRLNCVGAAGTAVLPGTGSAAQYAPGIHVSLAQPVNLLAPMNLGGRHHLLMGYDRMRPRGLEGGAGLADWRLNHRAPMALELTRYRSAGVFGAITFPQWQRNGVAVGAAGTEGTTNVLTNHPRSASNYAEPVEDFDFRENNPVDGIVASGVAAQAGSTTTAFTTTSIVGRSTNDYEHYILVVTTAGNLAAGDWRIVSGFTGGISSSVFTTRAWSAAPNTSVRWRLLRPFKRFRFYGDRTVTPLTNALDVRTTSVPPVPSATVPSIGATTVTLNTTEPDDIQTVNIDNSAHPVHLQMVESPRWGIRGARRWSSVYDTVTRTALLTNGESGILSYDGEQLTELQADTTSALAQYLAGKIADEKDLISGTDPSLLARSKFRKSPPKGKYITLFRNILVVGGSPTAPFTIWNSFTGGANNIWPLAFETQIRDQKGEILTGLASLYDRVFAFTRSSIHEGSLNDDGSLSFNPLAQGVGFSAHNAVVQVPYNGGLGLAGPATDGIYLTNGTEPVPILDNWSRLISDGINVRVLDRAVGGVLRSNNLAMWAVASRGSSTNDRILAWDYSANTWWVWRHPIGVSSMASVIVNGKETMAFGTDDGIVQYLWDSPDDDGSAINSYALSAPEQPMGPVALEFNRLNLTMRSLGSNQTLDVAFCVNERDVSTQGQLVAYPVTEDQGSFGDVAFGTGRFADERYKSFGVLLPYPARGTIAQYRVGGTARWRLRLASVEGAPKSSGGQP